MYFRKQRAKFLNIVNTVHFSTQLFRWKRNIYLLAWWLTHFTAKKNFSSDRPINTKMLMKNLPLTLRHCQLIANRWKKKRRVDKPLGRYNLEKCSHAQPKNGFESNGWTAKYVRRNYGDLLFKPNKENKIVMRLN